tara:strand:+ start:110 stop:613 length:504 start_codon:yes stop_codon:yes gene_type:complete
MANPMYGQNKFDNQVDNTNGEIISFTPASDGTAVAGVESLVLKSTDAGNYYFLNIASNTCSVKLPSAASSKGAVLTFIMDVASDAEGTKDFILFTNAATEFIMGACFDGAGVHDQPSDDDFIQIDSSDGAVGAGDRVQVVCNGQHWYVLEGSALTAGAWNSGTATRA